MIQAVTTALRNTDALSTATASKGLHGARNRFILICEYATAAVSGLALQRSASSVRRLGDGAISDTAQDICDAVMPVFDVDVAFAASLVALLVDALVDF